MQAGDEHIANVIEHLQKSPQWAHMLVVVTYDENGGIWDHVAPPKADRWGPGSRIPAIIVSPFAKKGFVDHTPNDTTSILRFITNRFGLATLPGIKARDEAMAKNGEPAARRPHRGAGGHPELSRRLPSVAPRPAPPGSDGSCSLIFLNVTGAAKRR